MTALLAAVPATRRFVEAPSSDAIFWAVPLGVFITAFLYALADGVSKPARRIAFAIEAIAAIVFARTAPSGFGPALTAAIAGQAPFLIGPRAGLALVGAQTIALAGVFAMRDRSVVEGLLGSGGYFGFQLFALGAGVLADREQRAREELARTNAELVATREMFADATRTAERLRIARDLHDAIGHHLTALRLQLEVARNASGDVQRDAIERSSDVARDLLGEVREVVSELRDERADVDLQRVLEGLAAAVPRPTVRLVVDPAIREADAAVLHAIFRFAQEAITNAARHARAEHLDIEIASDGDRVSVSARDDGRGATPLREGNGLKGLRERIEGLGGTFAVETAATGGVAVRAHLPLVAKSEARA